MINKSDNIYKRLEMKILSGEYRPGERIPTESDLCKTFGASRTSIRQALERLVVLGLLYKRQGSGTYVNIPDVLASKDVYAFIFLKNESVIDILNFCKTLEYGNAVMAAKNRTNDDVTILKKHIDAMQKHVQDIERFYFCVIMFRLDMAYATKNPLYIKMYEMLKSSIARWRLNQYMLSNAAERIAKEHINLCAAIEDKDEDMAEHVAKRIITNFIADAQKSEQ